MTRKSKRELERAVEGLDGGDEFDSPMTIRTIKRRVDQDGDVVDESERVVETGWEPEPRAVRRCRIVANSHACRVTI